MLMARASRILYMKVAETIRSDRFSSKSTEQRKGVCEEGDVFSRMASKCWHDKEREKSLSPSSPVPCVVGGTGPNALRKAGLVISHTLYLRIELPRACRAHKATVTMRNHQSGHPFIIRLTTFMTVT